MSKTTTAEISLSLDDFNDEEIRNEYELRNLGEDADIRDFDDEDIAKEFNRRHLAPDTIDADEREIRLLADMIVSGETDSALQLLHDLTGDAFSIASVKKVASQHTGRLF